VFDCPLICDRSCSTSSGLDCCICWASCWPLQHSRHMPCFHWHTCALLAYFSLCAPEAIPAPTQHAVPSVSVNEYQWKLGSKRAYHAMNWWKMALYRWSCSFGCVWLRPKETEITTAWGSVSSLLIYSFTSFLTSATLLSGHHHCRCFTSWHSVVRPGHCNWIHCLPRASPVVVNIQLYMWEISWLARH